MEFWSHFNAMLRLHERNTEWTWDTPRAKELSRHIAHQNDMEATSWNMSTCTTEQ